MTAYESVIGLIRPHIDFEIRDIDLLGSGTDNAAYLVNSTWVIRIPQNSNARQTLLKEIQLLSVLAKSLTIEIPKFEATSGSRQEPLFSIYKILPGRRLSPELFNSLSQEVQETLLRELFDFLIQLHAVSPESVPVLKEEVFVGGYNSRQRHFHYELESLLSRDEIQKVELIYKEFDADHRNHLLRPTVIHSDLKPAHVLMDENSGHVGGVLDWGDACLGDPDFDFACIEIFFGTQFLLGLLSLAAPSDRERILRKTAFFILVRAMQDVLFSMKHLDKKSELMALRGLKACISNFETK